MHPFYPEANQNLPSLKLLNTYHDSIFLLYCTLFSSLHAKTAPYLSIYVDGVLRVGRRLDNADSSYDLQHPVILFKDSRFTELAKQHRSKRQL